jgi:hypothetical protein
MGIPLPGVFGNTLSLFTNNQALPEQFADIRGIYEIN